MARLPSSLGIRQGASMTDRVLEIAGLSCRIADDDGPIVRDAEGGRMLIEDAMNHRASVIVVPVSRLAPVFFQLRSGLAGEVLQKAMNYGFKFAVVGDISGHVAASDALRDFVVESNRGRSVFFMPDLAALTARLEEIADSPPVA
jgi:hypothetical protein